MYPYLIQQVLQGNIKSVEKLLQAGINPNIRDDFGNTALFYANNIEMFKLLLAYKADINHETREEEHLLSTLDTNNEEIIQFLLNHPSLDINFKNTLGTSLIVLVCMTCRSSFSCEKKSSQSYIVKALIEKGCKVKQLYYWLKDKAYYTYKMSGYSCHYDINRIARIILSAMPFFSQENEINFYLKKLFILSASILKNDELLGQSMQLKSIEEEDFLKLYKDALLTSENKPLLYDKETDDISKVFIDIQTIFRTPSLCLILLQDLDNAVKAQCEKRGIIIEPNEMDNWGYLYSNSLVWVVPKNLNETYSIKTNNLLNNTLLDREETWGINLDKKVYTFKNFVPAYLARAVIDSSHIFIESFDNAIHGTNMHRIQLDMVETAGKLGILDRRGYTTEQLLKASVDENWWNTAFDNVADFLNDNYFPNTGLSSPQTLYSTLLLLKNELPFLSYFARKSLVQNLQKIQKLNPEYSLLTLYGMFTLTNGSFGIFHLNSFNPEAYYADRRKLTFFEKSLQVYAKQPLVSIEENQKSSTSLS